VSDGIVEHDDDPAGDLKEVEALVAKGAASAGAGAAAESTRVDSSGAADPGDGAGGGKRARGTAAECTVVDSSTAVTPGSPETDPAVAALIKKISEKATDVLRSLRFRKADARARIERALEIARADGRTPIESEVIALAISFGYGKQGRSV
jgi:hypothetical protein